MADLLKPYIDPYTDLAAEEWHAFKHHNWILPEEKEDSTLNTMEIP